MTDISIVILTEGGLELRIVFEMKRIISLPVTEYLEIYETALSYSKAGLSNTEIARRLDVDQSNISRWVNHKTSPFHLYRLFNLSPSPELAWLTGFLIGDGNIERRGAHLRTRQHPSWHYRIRTQLVEKTLVEYSADIIAKLSGYRPKVKYDAAPSKKSIHWNDQWGWSLKSRQFYEYLAPYWLERNLNAFEYVFLQHPGAFLRGIYDAEGSVAYYIGERNSLHKYIDLVNTDGNLLCLCEQLLKDCDIYSKVYPRKRVYPRLKCDHLTILRERDIRSFARRVGFASTAKGAKLSALVQMLDSRANI